MKRHPPRFFLADLAAVARDDGCARLDAEQSHHLVRVVRLSEGAAVELFDGDGTCADGIVAVAHRREAAISIENVRHEAWNAPVDLTLAVGLSKARAFDMVVQKASELNVCEVVPILASRCQGRREDQPRRWRRIAVDAARQCRRNHLLKIGKPVLPADFIAEPAGDELRLLLDVDTAAQPICTVLKACGSPHRVVCLIGPEGGLTDEEAAGAIEAGFVPVAVGMNVLRVETAVIAAAAVVMSHFEDELRR